MLPITLLENHKAFSDIRLWLHFWSLSVSVTAGTMPRTPSCISYLPLFPRLADVLGPIRYKPPLLSQTAS